MSELDKAKDVSKLGQVSSVDKTEGSKDDLKLSQKIDFTKYPNLERVSPEDLEALVTDKDGNLLPEEALKAADKAAGEKNTDGIQKNYDEDLEAVKNLGCYHLLMLGKFSKSGAESLHEQIHDKDDKLISEDKIKELDEKVRVDADAAMKKSNEDKKNEDAHKNLAAADEKNKQIDEDTEAVNKELEEVLGEDAFKEMKDKEQEEKEASGEKENNSAADLSTEEGRNDFIKKSPQYNESVDDERKIDFKKHDAEQIAVKYYGTDKKEEALEQLKESLVKTKEAKAQQEKMAQETAKVNQPAAGNNQNAEPNAEYMSENKVEDYVNTNPEKKMKTSGLYVNNTPVIQQLSNEAKINEKDKNPQNDKHFNYEHNNAMQKVLEEQKKLKFENGEENRNDPMALLAQTEGGPKNLKEFGEKLTDIQKGDTGSSAAALGASAQEKKLNPYIKTASGDVDVLDDLGKEEIKTPSASKLQFSKADKANEVADDIDPQIEEESAVFDMKIAEEELNFRSMEEDAGVRQKAEEVFNDEVMGSAKLAQIDATKFTKLTEAEEKAAQEMQDITNRQLMPEQQQETKSQETQKIAFDTLGKGMHLMANQDRAAAAGATPAGAAALIAKANTEDWIGFGFDATSAFHGAEEKKSDAQTNDLKRQADFAKNNEKDIAAVKKNLAKPQEEASAETVKQFQNVAVISNQQTADLLLNKKKQGKQVEKVKSAKDDRLEKLNRDKELLAKKQASTEKKETKPAENNNEVKETKEGIVANAADKVGDDQTAKSKDEAVANAGDNAGQNKKAGSGQEEVFEFKENEDVKQDDMKEQFANPLMDDGKEAKDAKQGPQSVLANAGAPKLGTDNAADENEDSEEDKDGVANVQFEAYSKENRITKEVLGVEDDGMTKVDTSEKQPKKPALRMASRFAKTAEKVNGVDGTAAKGFTA